MMTNIILECIDELLVSLHAFNVSDKGLSADKDLGSCLPTANCGHIGIDGIGGDGFIAAMICTVSSERSSWAYEHTES
jgi:hypothetical protein